MGQDINKETEGKKYSTRKSTKEWERKKRSKV